MNHEIAAMSSGSRRVLAPARMLGDERLALDVGLGSERAFAVLFDRYHQQLYRYCRSLVANDHDAQDALQATFTKALIALRASRRDAPLRPWLYRIAHNESVSLLRARPPSAEIPRDAESVGAVHESAEQRERLATLISDLQQLPEQQRAALVMREFSGLTHDEIAQALRVSAGAAKQSILEARRSLVEFAEGRAMECEEVQRILSDADGRTMRARRIRAHLRGCGSCSAFADAIPERRAEMMALWPALPAASAAGLLAHLTGSGSGASGGGAAGVAGGAAKGIGATVSIKAAMATGAAVVATAGAGVGVAVVNHDSSRGLTPAAQAATHGSHHAAQERHSPAGSGSGHPTTTRGAVTRQNQSKHIATGRHRAAVRPVKTLSHHNHAITAGTSPSAPASGSALVAQQGHSQRSSVPHRGHSAAPPGRSTTKRVGGSHAKPNARTAKPERKVRPNAKHRPKEAPKPKVTHQPKVTHKPKAHAGAPVANGKPKTATTTATGTTTSPNGKTHTSTNSGPNSSATPNDSGQQANDKTSPGQLNGSPGHNDGGSS